MISFNRLHHLFITGLLGIFVSTPALSQDISHTLRNNTEENITSENYLELGLSFSVGAAPNLTSEETRFLTVNSVINGSYEWNGLFIESYFESNDPILLGYNAYESDNWSFDAVIGSEFGDLHNDDRFDELDNRKASIMLGGRLTGYVGNYVLQFSLNHDITGHSHGTIASALIGQNWQIRNWNFHSLLGLEFMDSRTNDYYFGISAEEAERSAFSAYDAGASLNVTAEIGVTYPLSEDWLFKSTARARTIDDSIADSPLFLTPRSNAVTVSSSISYVF